MTLSRLISPLAISFGMPGARLEEALATILTLTPALELVGESVPSRAALECYLRNLVSRSAIELIVPSYGDKKLRTKIRSPLPPTLNKHLMFKDRDDRLWKAAADYVRPMIDLTGEVSLVHFITVSNVAWDLYLLMLGARHKCEVVFDYKEAVLNLKRLSEVAGMSAEAKARIAVLQGTYAAYRVVGKVPCLRFAPGTSPIAMANRLAEIAEDAYLLEASSLRRLFGIEQNLTALKRDLRKVLGFISRNRRWAKGLVSLSAEPLGKAVSSAATEVLGILEGQSPASFPVLVQPLAADLDRYWAWFELRRNIMGQSYHYGSAMNFAKRYRPSGSRLPGSSVAGDGPLMEGRTKWVIEVPSHGGIRWVFGTEIAGQLPSGMPVVKLPEIEWKIRDAAENATAEEEPIDLSRESGGDS